MYHELETKNISKELRDLGRNYWTLESGRFKYSVEELIGGDEEFNQRMIKHLEDIGYYEVNGKCNCCLEETSWDVTSREEYQTIIRELDDDEAHIFCIRCQVFARSLNKWLKNPRGILGDN